LLGGKDIHFLSVGLFAEAAYIKGAWTFRDMSGLPADSPPFNLCAYYELCAPLLDVSLPTPRPAAALVKYTAWSYAYIYNAGLHYAEGVNCHNR
jgi:hypothetical protein